MNNTVFFNNFLFNNFKMKKYHYTDSRGGASMNYLAYMKKGHCRIVSDDKTIWVNEGDIFFIPYKLGYQSYWYGNNEIDFLSFGFLNLNTGEKFRLELQAFPCEEPIARKLLEIPVKGIDVTCRGLGMFYSVMSELIPHFKSTLSGKDELVTEKAQKYIAHNPYCTMPEVADACKISQPYLYAAFKHAKNYTPNEYKQKILCRKGIELLITTDKTVEEISNFLCFSSSSYFRKILKKHTGNTPREIRKESIF